ncbi:MAG: S8 family peptidase [Bacteroidetes bacterium]|nr:S8 family peptidase [Bacteroidota bacterium]
MKNIFIILILSVWISANVFAENYNNKLTADTYVFLKMHENKSILNNKIKSKDYFLQSKNGIEYTKLYIKVNENYSKLQVENLGCKELVKTKSVALLSVPIDKIEQLSAFNFVELIEIAKQPQPLLDKALQSSNVDKVHQGIDLERSYFGEGVIVGVLDYGFDFTHPMFSDENGKGRIKRAWVPYAYIDDDILLEFFPPPKNSDVGFLLTDLHDFDIKFISDYSSNTEYHGTHVLAIAAGSKVEGQKYTHSGIATKSDIAIVELGIHSYATSKYDSPTYIEGIDYLFSYADSVGKPIVINMSFGTIGYPNDGTHSAGIMIKEMVNENPEGRILVASAGNVGNTKAHLENNFSNTIKSVECLLSTLEWGYAYFYAMGEIDKEFSITTKILDKDFEILTDSFTISTVGSSGLLLDTMISSFNNPARRFYVHVWAYESYLEPYITNKKPLIVGRIIPIYVSGIENADAYMSVRIFSDSGIIHCWNQSSPHGHPFIVKTQGIEPDANYTISSPGTEEEVISVGAYVTRDTIVPFAGNKTPTSQTINNIANFSSKGPLTDGRIKPDITAPGSILYSALHSFVGISNAYKDLYVTDKTPNATYEFIAAQGTSMSSPMVTGIVALMLEVNPKLTHSEIKDILRITAINDEYTGNAKENKSTIWGWGKINAHEIMKHLTLGIEDDEQDFVFNIFPNPITNGNANIQVENTTEMPYIINVYDETGRLVYLSSIDTEKQIDLSKLTTGTYFIKLHNHKAKSIQKVVKM